MDLTDFLDHVRRRDLVEGAGTVVTGVPARVVLATGYEAGVTA
jgi:hypothetical protein